MLSVARHQKILDYLSINRTARLTDLAEEVGAGLSTVRRDLRQLEERGLLERVHGGALWPPTDHSLERIERTDERSDGSDELPTPLRERENVDQKRRIGAAAAQLVRDGSTIIVTAGTTTAAMLPHLALKRELTVITNSVGVAYTLSRYPQITTVVLGGWLRHGEMSLLGHLVMQAVDDFHADQIYHGTYSLDPEQGLAGAFMQEVETDRAMIGAARELIVLADASKFERTGPVRLAPIERIATIVTDTGAPPAAVDALRARGIRVIQT